MICSMAVMLLQHVFVCCLYKRAHFSSLPVCSNKAYRMCTSIELFFNFGNVHSLFGMRRMPLDRLRWILFHTPLSSEQHSYSGLLDAILWVYVCNLDGGGGAVGDLGSDCDLERPSVPVWSPSLISWPIKYSNTGPSWEPWDLLENATDSLKSGAEITALFTSPPETCAKSSSCTSLCTGPLKARAELVSEYVVCMNVALTDTLKLSVPAGIYDLG